MADITEEGIAYLRALRKPAGSVAARAPVLTLETNAKQGSPNVTLSNAGDPTSHLRPEKRHGARHRCEGSVEIQQDGQDGRTWATFTDISLNGCYVEAQVTYDVGTVLHLKLEINGVRVECKAASVRVTYPHLGMGIAFVDMSEESRSRLKDLMSSISRPSVIMGPRLIASSPTIAPQESSPVLDPKAAIAALLEFFETRHMLLREDFVAIVAKSQTDAAKS